VSRGPVHRSFPLRTSRRYWRFEISATKSSDDEDGDEDKDKDGDNDNGADGVPSTIAISDRIGDNIKVSASDNVVMSKSSTATKNNNACRRCRRQEKSQWKSQLRKDRFRILTEIDRLSMSRTR